MKIWAIVALAMCAACAETPSTTNDATLYMWPETTGGRYVSPEVCHVRWTRTREACHLADTRYVTITAAEYAVLTNSIVAMAKRHKQIVERGKKSHEEKIKRAEERAKREYEEKCRRGVLRVRDIIKASNRARKGGRQ